MRAWHSSFVVAIACGLFVIAGSCASADGAVAAQPSCTGIESSDPHAATLTGVVPSVGGAAPSLPFVMVFPDNDSSENFVTYLSTHGKPPAFVPGMTSEALFARAQRQLQRMRDIPHALSTMRLAFLDKHGDFHCDGLAPGKYVVLLPVSQSTLHDPKAETNTYYAARVAVTRAATRSRRRRTITTGTFRSIDEPAAAT